MGLNGVGAKAVNALSSYFCVQAIREGKSKKAEFSQGILTKDYTLQNTKENDGTIITFIPDSSIFKNFQFLTEHLEHQFWNYAYLNRKLTLVYNGQEFRSKNGLLDLLNQKVSPETLCYDIVHLIGDDIEVALTHGEQYGEQHYSFVNGQYTSQGGTHLAAFRESLVKTIREFYKKEFDAADIREAMIGAISIRIEEPVFESQTKTKLGSLHIAPDGTTIRSFVQDFIKKELDDFLHKNPEIADKLLKKIQRSEKERMDLAGIRKLAHQAAKKANCYNKKLRDCRYHWNSRDTRKEETTIFITEGDSASGSLTQARDVDTQAVFSLRGKPLNCYGLTKKVVYENEEFNLLQHALNIEDGLNELRYRYVVVATDADVDGMHIRLLLLTFFLQFFPELVHSGHLHILETPLFRVRTKERCQYCYSEAEKQDALKALGKNAEITRFKGLGEISPGEFREFIGKQMRLTQVIIPERASLDKVLGYYMGKNTMERQRVIVENLRWEKNILYES